MDKSISAPNIRSAERLPSLDGLRAVSIALVVMGHSSRTSKQSIASTVLGFIGEGRFGVAIFFVISGFLITTLLLREQHATQTINLKDFYIRRAFRIFPGFYAYWLVVLGLTLSGYIALSRIDLISAALYVWNYVPRTVDSWFLGHTWSLSIEEQFYLLWPVILKLSGPKRGRWVALALVISAPFVRVATYFVFPSTRSLIGMMLHTRADSLMIGAFLALVSLNKDHLRSLKGWTRSWLIPIGALFFAVIDTLLTRHFKGAYLLPLGYSLQNIVIAVLIAHVVLFGKTMLGRFLNNRVVVHIGVISYSLYLWQQLFLTPRNTTFTGIFPFNILFAFLAAELSYYLLERPFLRWRKRFSNARQQYAELEKESINPPLDTKRFAAASSG